MRVRITDPAYPRISCVFCHPPYHPPKPIAVTNHIHLYLYFYMYREREREREKKKRETIHSTYLHDFSQISVLRHGLHGHVRSTGQNLLAIVRVLSHTFHRGHVGVGHRSGGPDDFDVDRRLGSRRTTISGTDHDVDGGHHIGVGGGGGGRGGGGRGGRRGGGGLGGGVEATRGRLGGEGRMEVDGG